MRLCPAWRRCSGETPSRPFACQDALRKSGRLFRCGLAAAIGPRADRPLSGEIHAEPPFVQLGPLVTRPRRSRSGNGEWLLSPTRNTAEIKAAAAQGYRFHLQPDGRIRWEIPSLHEVASSRSSPRNRSRSRSIGSLSEANRVIGVLDALRATHGFVAGNELSIADVANFGWMWKRDFAGTDVLPVSLPVITGVRRYHGARRRRAAQVGRRRRASARRSRCAA